MPDEQEPQAIPALEEQPALEPDPAVASAGLPDPITKTAVLEALREVEARLFSAPVVAEVKKQPLQQQMEFAQSRLHLTAVITRLNASLMSEIRQRLEAQAPALDAGIGGLTVALTQLEGAAGWAKAIDGVIRLLGKVVSLL
ncbi:MAG: hypothetical protein KDD11_00305 [Acidobacteria bacterium]|nr:hypothetical protein [Acidobacteriota bacterium]